MNDQEAVIQEIHQAFGENEYPGDNFLQGSFEGSEPCDDIRPFKGLHWKNIDSQLLDAHYTALHFFSEAGLRFFLPAYLIADLRGELQTADSLFVLCMDLVIHRSSTRPNPVSSFVRLEKASSSTQGDTGG